MSTKPHIRVLNGLWYCFLKDGTGNTNNEWIGLGYTPQNAYDVWITLGIKYPPISVVY